MGLDQAIRKLTPEVAAKIIARQEDGWDDLTLDAKEERELSSEEYDTIQELWTGRKENHIHRAIEDLTGEAVKNCDYLFISREIMEQLVEKLMVVNDDHTMAASVLPPQDGFFFGGTDINEWYFKDIEAELLDFRLILEEWDEDSRYAYWAWW